MISNELLKKKILDEAIHGRLVENDSSLEPIDVQPVNDNIPFVIPNNWKWINFKSGFELKQGIQINIESQSPVKNDIYPLQFLRIVDFTQNNKDIRYVSDKYINYFLEKNDVAMVRYGNPGFVCSGKEGVFANNLFKIIPKFKLKHKYLVYLLESDFIQNKILSHSVALSAIKFSDIYKLNITIQPLEEQEKIVKKIEELFELIDKKEKNDEEKEKLKVLLKEKILDSAIHGKIIENDLSLPAVDVEETKDAVPFDIPNNWKYTKIEYCVALTSGVTLSEELKSGDILYVKVSDMNLPENKKEIITSSRYQLRKNIKNIVPVGSIIFPKRGGAIKTNKKKLVLRESICVDLNTMAMTPNAGLDIMYLYYWFMQIDLGKLCNGTSVPQINNKDLNPLKILIPPLEQQKRIVDKIEKCFELIEQL